MRPYNSFQILKPICSLLFLLLPALCLGQEKGKVQKSTWSFNKTEKVTQIPIVQEVILDSINQRLQQLTGLYPELSVIALTNDSGIVPVKNLYQLKKNLQKFQLASRQQPFSLSSLSALYSLKEVKKSFPKRALDLKITDVQSSTIYDNRVLSDQTLLSQSSLGFTTQFFGLPFSYSLVNNYPALPEQQIQPWYKISFNQEQLLKETQKKLTQQFDVEKLLLKDLNFQQLFYDYAFKKLSALKENDLSKLKSPKHLFTNLTQLNVEEFLYLTKDQVKQRLVNKPVKDSLLQVHDTYMSLVNASNSILEKDSLQNKIASILESMTEMDAMVAKVLLTKESFESNGLNYNQLVHYQQGVNSKVDAITSSSSFTQEASKKLLNLNSITRLFLHIKELNIGQFSNDWSDRSVSGILTSGVSGSYVVKNKFLGLTAANIQTLGWLKDQSLLGNLSEPAMRFQALRIGKGELSDVHSHTTLVNASIKRSTSSSPSLSTLPRNIAVGSFSKNVSFGKYGKLAAEVGKSNTQYQRSLNTANELESKMALRQFGADLFQTLSFGLQYEGQFLKVGLEPQAFINYAGLGYTNPASSMQGRGALQYGFQAQKALLRKKLTLQTRFSKRENKLTVLDDRKMHQMQSSIASRYRISKKLRLGLTWNYSDLLKEMDSKKTSLFTSNRINADAFYSGKLRGIPLYQYVSTGYQQMTTPDVLTGINGKMLWMNSSTNVAFRNSTLSMSVQYYNSLSGSIQNDLLTADAGWGFSALKKVSFQTSFNYLSQEHTARQTGIKQTITTNIYKNLLVTIYADIRHDLIVNKNKFLYPNTRGDVQLTYKLN